MSQNFDALGFDVAAFEAASAEAIAAVERLRSSTFDGRDPRNLATALIDGQGRLVKLTFASMVSMHPVATVEDAVLGAVAAAHREMNAAWQALADRSGA